MDIRKIRGTLSLGKTMYSIPMRVTFYARVSTEKEEQASSLENQVEYFTEFIQKNENWVYVDGYIDEGISGISTLKRDNFNRMIEDAKTDLFDLIITKEVSRFSRNTLDSILYTQELLNMGVGVFFQNDNLNTLDTDSEFRLVVMAAVAQDEVRKMSERLKFGFRQSIKNGRVLGNGRMYGFNKANCKLTINEEEAETVRLIFDLYVNQQMGLRRISQYLYSTRGLKSREGNPFNTTTIKNMILNPKYKGYYCGNRTRSIDYKTKKTIRLDESEWIVYKDESIPTIVSEEVWDRANLLLKTRGRAQRENGIGHHNTYPYSGKIVCAEHGTTFHRDCLKSKQGIKEIWRCRTYRQRGLSGCTAPKVYSADIDVVLADIFSELHRDKSKFIEQVLALIQGVPDEKKYLSGIGKLQAEGAAILKKKEKLLELNLEGFITKQEFKTRNDALSERAGLLEEKIETLKREQEKSARLADNFPEIKKALETELVFEGTINSELVSCVLDKIIVYNTGNRDEVSLDIQLRAGGIVSTVYGAKRRSFCDSNLRNTTPNLPTSPTSSPSAPSDSSKASAPINPNAA